jgi:hypothetical protein
LENFHLANIITVNWEFMFWELHGTLCIAVVAGLKFELVVRGRAITP